MAKDRDGQPRKRFSKSGHTTHQPRVYPETPPPPPVHRPPPPPPPPPAYEPPPRRRYDDRYYDDYDEPRYARPRYEDDRYYDDRRYAPPPRRPRYDDNRYYDDDRRYPPPPPPRRPRYDDRDYADYQDDPYYDDRPPARRPDPEPTKRLSLTKGPPTGPDSTAPLPPGAAGPPSVGRAALTLGKATLSTTNRAARTVTRKVISASKSDGAHESGLTALIWNQVLSYGTDAMITVALAGTVFFGADANAKRGNVLLYLLITMAPFAVVAPVIGPVLDRFQHGRRWTMAGTAIGRAVLALIMASHPTELLILYPCALGSLVFSKAYGVVRAAAAPRLVPPGMTLTAANAKLTIFGLGSTLVLGGFVGILIKVSGSYSLGLIVTAIGFGACGFFAFSLPKQVDSATAAPRHPQEPPRPRTQQRVPPVDRLKAWARRGFDPHLVIALQGESALRLLSGLLTIYLAFYVETTSHGLKAALELAAVIGGAGAGNFAGTAIGTRVRMSRPELLIILSTIVAAATCIIAAISFDIAFAAIGIFVASVANALSKIALDSLIQNDVVETQRSSAFARSETFLQLAWVAGAAIGVGLPSSKGDGAFGFIAGGVIVGIVALITMLRVRAAGRTSPAREWPDPSRPGW